MSRMARVVVPDVAHHVIQRGVRSMDIFRDDADRREYLRLMAEECARWEVRLDERHLIAAVRYVERNPVRAGMVAEAWAYPWSSAAYRVGEAESDPLVAQREIAGTDVNWRALLKHDPQETSSLRRHTRTGRPLGDTGFVQSLESLTGRRLAPGRPGRPPKKTKAKARRRRR
jgi:putative transposase